MEDGGGGKVGSFCAGARGGANGGIETFGDIWDIEVVWFCAGARRVGGVEHRWLGFAGFVMRARRHLHASRDDGLAVEGDVGSRGHGTVRGGFVLQGRVMGRVGGCEIVVAQEWGAGLSRRIAGPPCYWERCAIGTIFAQHAG
jgi:hypothetical protein